MNDANKIRIKSFFRGLLGLIMLIIWFMNLVGTTSYIFWASSTMVDAGIIQDGFKLFGVLNILASAMAYPAVKRGWDLLMDTAKPE